ncbi:MAG: hypothetical protein F6K28_27825, partial [Microcoleus sp. SIO2G3]|nr:hypothetical protein [Microcoleus sp. SIO2G3]
AKWRQIEKETSRQPLAPLDEAMHCTTEAEAEDHDLAAKAFEGLGSLEEPYRSCVVGSVFGQLKDEQLAQKHRISIEEVRLNIQEGLRRLREGLGEQQEIG